MSRTYEGSTVGLEVECTQEYEHTGEERTVRIEGDITGTGVWLYVDGEIVGNYSLVELAQAVGEW